MNRHAVEYPLTMYMDRLKWTICNTRLLSSLGKSIAFYTLQSPQEEVERSIEHGALEC